LATTFEDLFIQKLTEEAEFHTVALAEGSINSYEEYKYKTGLIQGLGLAGSIFNDLADRMRKDQLDD
jgi:hypothetical protein